MPSWSAAMGLPSSPRAAPCSTIPPRTPRAAARRVRSATGVRRNASQRRSKHTSRRGPDPGSGRSYARRMPNVTSQPSGNPVVGELIVLEDELAETRVVLSPARGGLVTSFQVRGRELLYLDEPTLGDENKNVRGGIPVLFPSPGKLSDDAYTSAGKRFTMKQHGFARALPWALESTLVEPVASVTIGLVSNAATLAQYPWAFGAKMTFSVTGRRLRIAFRVENSGATEMPYALGFHPYFLVRDKASA